jgi:hypothetical protein
MSTKIITTYCSIFLAAAGLVLTFMPEETLRFLNSGSSTHSRLFAQTLGALYFSFAMLDWMSGESVVGGIYNRPVAVANFTHFYMAGIALVKGLMSDQDLPVLIWAVAITYMILAVVFGVLLFRHPVKQE